ncbi:CPBP family intramembrane metalloprotease [Funiculus sociatus GB2-A5]|uniref:CPBP family intramembrane metalloprotease n=1 Tax=Funiculus sociatus GB2-A5 TaxID=2933946 RepID=A0ABV0JM42_9CYAN|nr:MULTISPECIES: type II CAAX endopeptidase family protein [unclassified Trichocoleus]
MFKLNLVHLAQYPAPVRLGLFVLSLLSIWLPLAAPIYIFVKDTNLVTILTMGLLFVEFLLLLRFWGQNVYQQSHLLRSYGLQGTRRNGLELLSGLGVGVIITFSLFWLEGLLGWLVWQSPTVVLPRLIVEGLASALGIGLAEELVFRGWLLDELERDYRPRLVLWADVLIFALLHFLKPPAEILRTLPGFPGLILFGLTLVWAKRGSKGRLGLPIGLHAGMVWGYYIINVGQMVQFSGLVSDWITGVDKNPLAGAMGLMFLGVLAFLMRMRSRSPKISS